MLQVRLEFYLLVGRNVPALHKSVGITSGFEMFTDVREPNFYWLSEVGVEIHALESVEPSRALDGPLALKHSKQQHVLVV